MDKEVILGPLVDVWGQLVGALPTLLTALVILIIGLLASSILSRAARLLISKAGLDDMLSRISFMRKAQESGWKIRPSHIIGNVVKWFFIIFTLVAVSEQLGLDQISEFLNRIVNYIPQVVVGVVLLGVGFVVGQFVHDIVRQSLRNSSSVGEDAKRIAPLVAKYAIIVFSGMAAATQLGIAPELIQTFFTAFVAAFALALGLAFGLGGKDHASKMLDKICNR